MAPQRRHRRDHRDRRRSGTGFGFLLIAFGVLLTLNGAPGGLWFALIGVFLVIAASAERLQEQVVTTFTGVHAEELMSQPVISIPSEWTVEQAQQYFARQRYTAFPVTDASGRAIGILSIGQLERGRVASGSSTSSPIATRRC